MSCNRNDASRLLLLAGLALAVAACAKRPPEEMPPPPVMAPPPPPAAAPAPVLAPDATYRIRTASPSVLQRYPRGTEVTRDSIICLAAGEQITVVGSNGQQVSYTGPGCMQRTGRPTSSNQGGFVFGWNAFASPDEMEKAR